MGKHPFSPLLLAIFIALSTLIVPATPVAAQQPNPGDSIPCDDQVVDLLDARSCDARNTPRSRAAGVPLYGDTGIGQVADWKGSVPQGYVLIVGGVTLQDNTNKIQRVDDGFMIALGPGSSYDLTVVDGFYKFSRVRQSHGEFCVRIWQALELNGWVLRFVRPLEGANWKDCWSQYVRQ